MSQGQDREQTHREPIAIIGIGCRFPGTHGPEAFWNHLCEGKDLVTEIPQDRFPVDELYDPRPATPGKIITRWGGFLENIDEIDSSFFSIAPREATYVDPQHRLLLETAWEALEDAGEVPSTLRGSRTCVFIGEVYNDYETIQFSDKKKINIYSSIGSMRSFAAGRLSYALDLRGPSICVDTACSSSLVAVHLACQNIWQGESSMALAGGVNLILLPGFTIGYSQADMLSPEGRCKAFDASDQPCWIGSVKTNIGHTEGAAGIAGLIKTALCIKHRLLPPSLHVKTPNPKIPWDEIPLRIQRELTSWPAARDDVVIAGVSAFGISGTNAHVVLTSVPAEMAKADTSPQSIDRAMLLPLSARSAQSLKQMAQRWREFLASSEQGLSSLHNLCMLLLGIVWEKSLPRMLQESFRWKMPPRLSVIEAVS